MGNTIGKFGFGNSEKQIFINIFADKFNKEYVEILNEKSPFFTYWITPYVVKKPEIFYRPDAIDFMQKEIAFDPLKTYSTKDNVKLIFDEAILGIYFLDILNGQISNSDETIIDIHEKYIKYINWYLVLYEYILPKILLPVVAKEKLVRNKSFLGLKSDQVFHHIVSDKNKSSYIWKKQDINFSMWFDISNNIRNSIAHGEAILDGETIVFKYFNSEKQAPQNINITVSDFERFFLTYLDLVNGFAFGFKNLYISSWEYIEEYYDHPHILKKQIFSVEQSHPGANIVLIDSKVQTQINILINCSKVNYLWEFSEVLRLVKQASVLFPKYKTYLLSFEKGPKIYDSFVVKNDYIKKYEEGLITFNEYVLSIQQESLTFTKFHKNKLIRLLHRKYFKCLYMYWYISRGLASIKAQYRHNIQKSAEISIVEEIEDRKVDDIKKVRIKVYYINKLNPDTFFYKVEHLIKKYQKKFRPTHVFLEVYSKILRKFEYIPNDDNQFFLCICQWRTHKKCSTDYYKFFAREHDYEANRIRYWFNKNIVKLEKS